MPNLPAPKRILVIMLRRIGDVLLTTPALRALKRLHPEAELDVLTEPPCHEVLLGNPDIHEVLVYGRSAGGLGLAGLVRQGRWALELRRRRYDWAIDYMGNPRSALLAWSSGAAVRAGPGHVAHRWAYSHPMRQSPAACYAGLEKIRMLRSLGIQPDESDFLPRLHVPESSRSWARAAAADILGPRDCPLIGFIPASRKETRRWPADLYVRLGRLLAERRRARIIVFWGPGEEALAREVARGIGPAARASPQTRTLPDLAALIGRCRLAVTNCNGPKHIAVAVGTPTLTIHGSSDPASWNPPDEARHPFIRREDLPCIGCRSNVCRYRLECLRELPAEAVTKKAEELLDRARAARPAQAL